MSIKKKLKSKAKKQEVTNLATPKLEKDCTAALFKLHDLTNCPVRSHRLNLCVAELQERNFRATRIFEFVRTFILANAKKTIKQEDIFNLLYTRFINADSNVAAVKKLKQKNLLYSLSDIGRFPRKALAESRQY